MSLWQRLNFCLQFRIFEILKTKFLNYFLFCSKETRDRLRILQRRKYELLHQVTVIQIRILSPVLRLGWVIVYGAGADTVKFNIKSYALG